MHLWRIYTVPFPVTMTLRHCKPDFMCSLTTRAVKNNYRWHLSALVRSDIFPEAVGTFSLHVSPESRHGKLGECNKIKRIYSPRETEGSLANAHIMSRFRSYLTPPSQTTEDSYRILLEWLFGPVTTTHKMFIFLNVMNVDFELCSSTDALKFKWDRLYSVVSQGCSVTNINIYIQS